MASLDEMAFRPYRIYDYVWLAEIRLIVAK